MFAQLPFGDATFIDDSYIYCGQSNHMLNVIFETLFFESLSKWKILMPLLIDVSQIYHPINFLNTLLTDIINNIRPDEEVKIISCH